ncbi:MAG: type II toxin-antitoxin system VapC family toxin [Methanobrevibacter sp.]|jgi:predicted nucleic acid-binding protein|nr:type II toxin-antitoxin system VapC family toxin [Candidatus Methanovirga procula]
MIFVDASFLVSLITKEPGSYDRAIELWEKNKHEDKLITPSVISEVINTLNVRLKVDIELIDYACEFMHDNLVITDDYEYHAGAVKNIKSFQPSRVPFFDCLYMNVMEELGIKEILCFDKHFDLNKNIKRIY